MVDANGFFEFAAQVGLTKHLGGLDATEELLELCGVTEDSYLLDVGCGVGATPSFISQRTGCRVMGVDISAKMIERSREYAEREGVSNRTEFRVAGVEDLPFDDGTFDAVLSESVTAFAEDKAKAVREYARVTKPGGFVGLNESTWLKVPPPSEILDWASQDLGASVKPLTAEEWAGLLAAAGLQDRVVKVYPVDVKTETQGLVARYGRRGMLRIILRMFKLFATDSDYRRFAGSLRREGVIPDALEEYFGYGLYVGQKTL
jgi:arsenite methyltransferase